MKQRLANLNRKGGGGNAYFKPKDGEQTIRVVCAEGDDDPFKEFWQHYNVGKNAGFLCLKKNFDETCPVCEFAHKLWTEDSDESKKLAKDLFPRQRFYSPVVVRGEEDQGVRTWGYSKSTYEALLNLVLNPEYGDITDADEGTDLKLVYGKPAGSNFPQTRLTPNRKVTPLSEDAETTENLLANVPDISSQFERKSREEIQAMLDDFVMHQMDAPVSTSLASEPAPAKRKSVKTTEEAVAAPVPSGSAVDKAFDELLG